MIRSKLAASAAFAATVCFGISAMAQQAAGTAAVGVQGTATAQGDTNAAAQATPAQNQQAQVGMGLPNATNAPAPGGSDHDGVVGHLAVGFLGRASMPLLGVTAAGAPNGATVDLPVPVIGVRYWMDPMIGLDVGLGLFLGGTSTDTTTTPPGTKVSTSGPKPAAFMLHAGVPLALASARHFTFEVIPEANFGYASQTQDAAMTAAGLTKLTGVHLDVGARAGGEIHFGFMGIPQLSLVGSVGMRFNYDKLGYDATPVAPAGSPTAHQSTGIWSLGTTVNESPWNIFISNVSAFYYF